MIKVKQYGLGCNRNFIVRNPKKIQFWKSMSTFPTRTIITVILWERS